MKVGGLRSKSGAVRRSNAHWPAVAVLMLWSCGSESSEWGTQSSPLVSPAGSNLPDNREIEIPPVLPSNTGSTSLCPTEAGASQGDRWFLCGHTIGAVSRTDEFGAKWPNGTDGASGGGASTTNTRIVAIHAALTHTGDVLYFSGDGYDRARHRGDVFEDSRDLSHYGVFDSVRYRAIGLQPPPERIPGVFRSIPDLFCSGHAALEDGRILAAGGMGYREVGPTNPDEGWNKTWAAGVGNHSGHFIGGNQSVAFDPVSASWKLQALQIVQHNEFGIPVENGAGGGRWYPTLVPLADGRVSAHWGHPGNDDGRHTNDTAEAFRAGNMNGQWSFLGFEPDQAKSVETNRIDGPGGNTSGPTYPRIHLLPSGLMFRASPTTHRSAVGQENLDWDLLLNSVLDPNLNALRRDGEFVVHVANGEPVFGGGTYSPFDNNTWWSSVLLPLDSGSPEAGSVLVAGGAQSWLLDLSHQALQSVSGLGGDAYSTSDSDAPAPEDLLQWSATGAREAPVGAGGPPNRLHATLTLLPTGEVLMTGGRPDSFGPRDYVKYAELYDPYTDQWRNGSEGEVGREYHSVAVLLPDGRVWHAGSSVDTNAGSPDQDTRIEIYEPWYVGHAARPSILQVATDGPAGSMHLRDGNTYVLTESEDAQDLRFAIMRPGTVTHAWNMGQRHVSLESTIVSSRIVAGGLVRAWHRVVGPPSSNVAPPGDYLIYAINTAEGTGLGVPSEGEFVHLDRTVTAAYQIPAGNFTRSFTGQAVPPTGSGDYEFSNGWVYEYTGVDLGPKPGSFGNVRVGVDSGADANVQLVLDGFGGPPLAAPFTLPGSEANFVTAPSTNLLQCTVANQLCLRGIRNLDVNVVPPCPSGGSCGGSPPPSRVLRHVELLPGAYNSSLTALFATDTLNVNSFASVREPISGANPAIVGGVTTLHPHTQVGSVLSNGRFEAYWGTEVHGFVHTPLEIPTRVDADVQISGGLQRGVPVATPDLSGWRQFSRFYGNQGQSTAVTQLNSGDWAMLEPGYHGSITLNAGATLVLKAGTYHLQGLTLNSDSNLELPVEDGVTIYVDIGLTLRGNVIEHPSWDQDNPGLHGNLRIIYLGNWEVHVGNTPFIGTIVAPNAKITLNTTNPNGAGALARYPDQPGHHGAFYAKEIELHQGTPVWFYPYRPWAPHPGPN